MGAETGTFETAFPRVHAYLRDVPGGLKGHPGCLSKASIYRNLLDLQPVDTSRGVLPAALVELIETPSQMSAWVPTVLVNAIELAVADACGSDAQFLATARKMNQVLLGSALYRAMFVFLSTSTVLKTSSSVWGRFHVGAPLQSTFAKGSASLTLTFPDRLYPRLLLAEKSLAFRCAAELSGATNVVEKLVEHDDRHGVFTLDWE